MQIVSYAVAILGSTFFFPLIVGLTTKRVSKEAAIASSVGGAFVCGVWTWARIAGATLGSGYSSGRDRARGRGRTHFRGGRHDQTPRRCTAREVFPGEGVMLGLPFGSFLLLFVLPGLVLIPMFYYSWLIKTGKRD